MPSPKLRQMQDEAAELAKTIATLRAMEPKDDADATSIAERLDAAMKRSDEVSAIAAREQEIDRRLEAMNTITAPGSQLGEGRGEQAPKKRASLPAIGSRADSVVKFESREQARELGLFLRDLAEGKREFRGELGTDSGYTNAGAELVMTGLYPQVVNQLTYTSAFAQLAMPFENVLGKMKLPKIGDIAVDYVAQGEEWGEVTPTTDGDELVNEDMGAWIPINNRLLETSPIDVARTIAIGGGAGVARKIDNVFMNGHIGMSITGLCPLISAGRTIELAGANATANDIGNVIGAVDRVIGPTSWVVSSVGFGQLMKVYANQQSTVMVGGGRMVPQINGSPVFIVENMPEGVLGLYGDFMSACAFGFRPEGFTIRVLREVNARKNQTVFQVIQSVGILNHAPEFVAMLVENGGS